MRPLLRRFYPLSVVSAPPDKMLFIAPNKQYDSIWLHSRMHYRGGYTGVAETSKITASLTENGILCKDVNGAQVTAGGPGPKASDLLLMAIAGCSGGTLNVQATGENCFVMQSVSSKKHLTFTLNS